MTTVGVFRVLRVLGALSLASAAMFGASCADVQVIDTAGPAPEIGKVEPTSGPSEGGTPVVITGQRFEKGATVRFGGRLAAKMEWVNETTLNALTPPGNGPVSVSVENPGKRVDTVDEAFTYEGPFGCAVVATSPELGAKDMPVVGEFRLTYSTPLDVTSLEGAVKLRLLGTDQDVPVQIALGAETDSEVIVTPQQSLRFWGAYSIVATGVKGADGSECAEAGLAFSTIAPEPLPRGLRPAAVHGLLLSGNTVIATSEGYRGLQMYDVSNPANTALKSDLVTSFGPRSIVQFANKAYAASGFAGVTIFDVADPSKPVALGYGGTPGFSADVDVFEQDGRTFVLSAELGNSVRVLDVTEPDDVTELGTLNLGPGTPAALTVDRQGDRIAVATGSKFALVELKDPLAVSSQTLWTAFDVGRPVSKVLLDGDLLFVGRSRYGMEVYNISDPTAPVLVDSEEDTDGPCLPSCLDEVTNLVRDGEDLFVAYGRGGVVRYSVANDGKVTFGTKYDSPDYARAISVTGEHVFVGGDEGLLVFDRAGDGSKPVWFDPNGHGVARTIAVRKDVAYVTATFRGLQTYSLENPEAPALIDRDDTPASLGADVAASGLSLGVGDILAVGDGRAGVTVFNVADPKNPILQGESVDTSDGVGAALQVEQYTYVCNGNAGVVVTETSDTFGPKFLAEVSFDDFDGPDGCNDLALAADGKLLYVGRARGLGVLDIAEPSKPAWKALVILPSKDSIRSMRAVGSHVVALSVGSDYEGKDNVLSKLRVFDAFDPAIPKLVWTSGDDLGGAVNLAVVGDKAFVAANTVGVKVFDLSAVESPVLEGTIATPGSALFVTAGTDILYSAQGAGGIQAIKTGPLPKVALAK